MRISIIKLKNHLQDNYLYNLLAFVKYLKPTIALFIIFFTCIIRGYSQEDTSSYKVEGLEPFESNSVFIIDSTDDLYKEITENEKRKADYFYNLGMDYYMGNEVDKNKKKAFRWIKKSAESGHKKAQYNLGYLYKNGDGVGKDYDQFLSWLTKSAENGYPKAQLKLGGEYLNGPENIQNNNKAISWLEKAGNQGVVNAQAILGMLYYRGNEETSKNFKKAAYWFEKAYRNGDKDAKEIWENTELKNYLPDTLFKNFSYSAASFVLPKYTKTQRFSDSEINNTLMRYSMYINGNWLGFKIFAVSKLEESLQKGLDTFFNSVTQYLYNVQSPQKIQCPNIDNYNCSAAKTRGMQGGVNYYKSIYIFEKNGNSVWVNISRSNDPEAGKYIENNFWESFKLKKDYFN